MELRKHSEHTEKSRIDETFDRLIDLLKQMPPERQEAFQEYLDSEIDARRRSTTKGHFEVVD